MVPVTKPLSLANVCVIRKTKPVGEKKSVAYFVNKVRSDGIELIIKFVGAINSVLTPVNVGQKD